jgi:hypothetical protein
VPEVTGEQYLTSRLQQLRGEANALSEEEFDPEEMWRFGRDAAAMFERFLQGASLSQPPSNTKLFHLVNALEHDGVAETDRQRIHAIRKAANDGKHDPAADMSYGTIDKLLAGGEKAVAAMATAGVPGVVGEFVPPYRRRFMIAVYDHLTGGESEFYVWLAGNEPRMVGAGRLAPHEIESFQFKFSDEEHVRRALDATGDLAWGSVPDLTIEALKEDSEFTEAGYWEGAYRDLVAACAPHQHNMELLPGLARHEQVGPVVAALAMSAVDLMKAGGTRPDAEALLAQAAVAYAIRRTSRATTNVAPAVAAFLTTLPSTVDRLLGPRFLGKARFAEGAEAAVSTDADLGFAVDANGWLLVET